MQFLKTIFWVALAVVAVIFSFNNWTDVHIALFGGMTWDTKLPVPLFFAFLIGLVPALVLHRATRWSMRRKLNSAERALADVRMAPAEPTPPAPPPVSASLPPAAAPIAVPPGVS
jgi:uncharacterized integral membrane protein